MPGELEHARVVLHVLAVAIEHDALEIVVEQRARHAAERLEGAAVAMHEALEPLIEREAGVHRARPAEHQHEAAQGATRLADLHTAEARPVDLALLAGQRVEREKRFGAPLRAHAPDVAAHLHDAAHIAPRSQHLVQARRPQPRVLVERPLDEVLVRVEQRWPRSATAHETVGIDDPSHRVVMHTELAGDRPDLPVLGEEEAAELRLELLADHAASTSSSRRRSEKPPRPSRPRTMGSRRSLLV